MMAFFPTQIPTKWTACTPSDSTDVTGCCGFRVNVDGDVAVRTLHDPSTTVTFVGCVAGEQIPGNFTRIMAATTATVLLAY